MVPPVILIPFKGLAAFADGVRKSAILLFERVIVVPDETNIPFTAPDALSACKLQMVFFEYTWVVPPELLIPDTVEAPVVLKPVIVFPVKVCVPEAEEIPVIAPPPVILLIVLLLTVALLAKLVLRTVTALVPPVQLEKVFPEIVFTGEPPSVLDQPAMVVAPVTVIFEKLLLLFCSDTVTGELPLLVNKVTVPPAPVLLNAVTIELPLIFWKPLAGNERLLDINVTLPVVLQVIFVKVLLLILIVWCVLVCMIKIIAPVPATVCPKLLKSLLFIFIELVALAEPEGQLIPVIAPAIRPLLKDILLLLILFVKVAVGVALAAGKCIP